MEGEKIIFNGLNYEEWKPNILAVLKARKCGKAI
jgi:hypothetical protein